MKRLIILALVCFGIACSPVRVVKPLQKGEVQVGANFGGPLIHLGDLTLTVPFTSVYGAYGLTDRVSLYGGLHTTSLGFGTIQIDAGLTHGILEQKGWKPGISYGLGLNSMLSTRDWETRLYPNLDLNLYWNSKNERWTSYVGNSNWLDFHRGQIPDGSQQNYWIPNFHFGERLKLGSWYLTAEYKSLFPFHSNEDIVVNYATFGNRGAHGFYLGISKSF